MGYGLTLSLVSLIQIHYISIFFNPKSRKTTSTFLYQYWIVCFSQKANSVFWVPFRFDQHSSKQKYNILGGEAPSQTSYLCQSWPSRKRTELSLTPEGARYTVYLKRIKILYTYLDHYARFVGSTGVYRVPYSLQF